MALSFLYLWVPESPSWVLSCEFVGEASGHDDRRMTLRLLYLLFCQVLATLDVPATIGQAAHLRKRARYRVLVCAPSGVLSPPLCMLGHPGIQAYLGARVRACRLV
jgi:hypothetical protein